MSLEEMREFMEADSLAFLSVDGIYRAIGLDHRDDRAPQFTDHCFTGDYPTSLTDHNGECSSSTAFASCRSRLTISDRADQVNRN